MADIMCNNQNCPFNANGGNRDSAVRWKTHVEEELARMTKHLQLLEEKDKEFISNLDKIKRSIYIATGAIGAGAATLIVDIVKTWATGS